MRFILLAPSKSNFCVLDVPSPPQNLRVTGTDDGLISVAWDAPKSDGGSSITGYAVEHCKSGSTVWNPAAEVDKFTLAADLKNLAPGDFYFVRVYSENEIGKSRRALDLYEPVCAKKPSSKRKLFVCIAYIFKFKIILFRST